MASIVPRTGRASSGAVSSFSNARQREDSDEIPKSGAGNPLFSDTSWLIDTGPKGLLKHHHSHK